jgi:hypothetical protein
MIQFGFSVYGMDKRISDVVIHSKIWNDIVDWVDWSFIFLMNFEYSIVGKEWLSLNFDSSC